MVGFVTAAYYISATRTTGDRRVRIFVCVGTVVTACLVDLYVNAWALGGFLVNHYLVPNLAVIAGVGVYTILRYDSTRRPGA